MLAWAGVRPCPAVSPVPTSQPPHTSSPLQWITAVAPGTQWWPRSRSCRCRAGLGSGSAAAAARAAPPPPAWVQRNRQGGVGCWRSAGEGCMAAVACAVLPRNGPPLIVCSHNPPGRGWLLRAHLALPIPAGGTKHNEQVLLGELEPRPTCEWLSSGRPGADRRLGMVTLSACSSMAWPSSL